MFDRGWVSFILILVCLSSGADAQLGNQLLPYSLVLALRLRGPVLPYIQLHPLVAIPRLVSFRNEFRLSGYENRV
jgi:hypothetical protein